VARVNALSLGAASYQEPGAWTTSVSYRWQYSDRHFVGDEEQVYREKQGSQIINDIHTVDLSVAYNISKRFSVRLGVPFQFASRSQPVFDTRRVGPAPPAGTPDTRPFLNPNPVPAASKTSNLNGAIIDRFETTAAGLSDMRVVGSMWLLNPEKHKDMNVSVGLGVLIPTGEKDVMDVFETYDAPSNTIRAQRQYVDNSIQPGSGAWGIIAEISAFKEFTPKLTAFVGATYISVPEETAGVKSGNPLTSTNIWSVNDQYLVRGGVGYKVLPEKGLMATLGMRWEGAPSEDIIGSSGGRRRPGYAVAIELGLIYAKHGWAVAFSTPVAIYRNRTADFTGNAGDAAFADFLILWSVSRTF